MSSRRVETKSPNYDCFMFTNSKLKNCFNFTIFFGLSSICATKSGQTKSLKKLLQQGIYRGTCKWKLQFNGMWRSHWRNHSHKGNPPLIKRQLLGFYDNTRFYLKLPSKKTLEALKSVNSMISFSLKISLLFRHHRGLLPYS